MPPRRSSTRCRMSSWPDLDAIRVYTNRRRHMRVEVSREPSGRGRINVTITAVTSHPAPPFRAR